MKVSNLTACAAGIVANLVLLTGCLNHDTVDGEVTPQVQTIATFEGNTPTGASFSYIAQGDGPRQLLQAHVKVDTVNLHTGNRVLLTYIPREIPGEISLINISRVNGGALKTEAAEDLSGWDTDPLFVEAMWRTGTYINLRCKILWAPEPRRYWLEADSNTLNREMPDLYVAHVIPDSTNRAAAYMALNYASFDISPIWENPDVKGVKIHINNSNLTNKQEFIFTKNN